MSDPKPLSRAVLAKFLPNHEAIKAFEALISMVSTNLPTSITNLSLLLADLEVSEGITSSKASQALASLQSIAQSLDLLAAAPIQPAPAPQDQFEVVRLREEVAILSQAVSELQANPLAASNATQITAGTGLTGGVIVGSGTIALADQIVAGGPTGGAATAVILTYNAQGQLTTVGTATITPAAIGADVAGAAAAVTPTTLGLVIGTNVQAYDADLTIWAGITPGANVGAFLATPSSANLRAALTDETGTGGAVFATAPTLTDVTVDKLRSVVGTTVANNATPTTIFTIAGAGMYFVYSYLLNNASSPYTAVAIVIETGNGTPTIINTRNGANWSLSLSGANVQVTQTTGGAQAAEWSYLKVV